MPQMIGMIFELFRGLPILGWAQAGEYSTMNEIYEIFLKRWTWQSPELSSDPVSMEDLEAAENELVTKFPQQYLDFMTSIGSSNVTIDLLDAVVDQELDLADVSDFHSPEEIVSSTVGWRDLGMDAKLVAFASDCSGNLFGFEASNPDHERPATSRIWLFDHDFKTNEVVAGSFEAWIQAFNDIP